MPTRVRIMLGMLLVSILMAVLDSALRPAPRGAKAAPADGAAQPAASRPPRTSIDALLTALRAPAAEGQALPLKRLSNGRSVFSLSDAMRAALSAARRPAAPAAGGPAAEGSPEGPSLPQFTLRGILAGQQPMALIDDRLLSAGGRIGDYQVVRIDRETVVLSDGEHELTLTLSPQP